MEHGSGRRRRRTHSAEFKAEAVAACQKPDASIAACALERSINANLLRRWVIEAERPRPGALALASGKPAVRSEGFVAIPIAAPEPTKSGDDTPVRIEIRRGSLTVNVQWPASTLHACAMWLRELLQ
jgi:transposase-like protein